MNPKPIAPGQEQDEEDEEEQEDEEESSEDRADDGQQLPPPLPLRPAAPPMPSAEKASYTPESGPNINQHLLNLVAKRLEMQAQLIEQMLERQERLYQQHQEDRRSLQSLTSDLSTLSEMMQETIGTVDNHAERLTEALAALIRLHQESRAG